MKRFVTLLKGPLEMPYLLWEDDETPPVQPVVKGRFATLDEVPDHDGIEVWNFRVPVSTEPGSAVNQGGQPVVDADGAPLWAGCRVTFRVPTVYVNSVEGDGELRHIDRYGGIHFRSDYAMKVFDSKGGTAGERREQNTACSELVRTGDLRGMRILKSSLGDGFEHGVTETYFRLDDDPRNVCTLEPTPTPAPM